ncbi:MAG: imidazoleglycerol-phosphate dehydratase HisB [Chloroflexi bacterium]|nr:imidazoleglycerol-phosphate dehydratase HisB [Chloroflexota bacterium]
MAKRVATIRRETGETTVNLQFNIDGSGKWETGTGVRFLDHMLSQLARHGLFDLKVSATGSDQHHLVEDVAICLGKAFGQALGEKQGIARMASISVPMDDALAMVAVDVSGRGYCVTDLPFNGKDIDGMSTDLVRHFLSSFATEARLNLHARVLYGNDDHHKAEAVFKALGKTLDAATRIDERISGIPSTKGMLEG